MLVVGLLTVIGQAVGDQFAEVADRAEEGLQSIQEWLTGPPFNLSPEQFQDWIDRAVASLSENREAITAGALSTATLAVEVVTGILLGLFSLIFFLYDGDRIWAWLVRLMPRNSRERVYAAGQLAWLTLTQYVRGTVLIAVFDATFISILLLVLGVPLALPLGLLVFFGAFVPLVGAFVTGALAVLVALVANGWLRGADRAGGNRRDSAARRSRVPAIRPGPDGASASAGRRDRRSARCLRGRDHRRGRGGALGRCGEHRRVVPGQLRLACRRPSGYQLRWPSRDRLPLPMALRPPRRPAPFRNDRQRIV